MTAVDCGRAPDARTGLGTWLIAGAALLACAGHATAVRAEEAAGVDKAQVEKQLELAQERLEDAATEVAQLTRKLYGDDPEDVLRFVGRAPHGAMLGISIASDEENSEGVRVVAVSPGGPAAAAGLRTGDVIVALDGKPLVESGSHDPSERLIERMHATTPGQSVKVDYLRGGKRESASVKTTKAEPAIVRMMRDRAMLPALQGVAPIIEQFAMPPFDVLLDSGTAFRSLELVGMTPKLGQYFGTEKGLLVVRAPSSPAYRLEEGDVLLSIDGRVPESPGHAFRILRSYQPGEQVKLQVMRNRKSVELVAKVPPEDSTMSAPNMFFRAPLPPHAPAPPAPPARADGDSA